MLQDKEEKEWAAEEVEKLVDFYRDNEELWYHRLPSYRDRTRQEVNMCSLCELLPGRSNEHTKKEWQTLKTIYLREVKRVEGSKVSGVGTDDIYTSSWRYFNSIEFIKVAMK